MTKIEAGALGHELHADLEMLGQSGYVLFSLGHLPSTQATGDLSPLRGQPPCSVSLPSARLLSSVCLSCPIGKRAEQPLGGRYQWL